METPATILRVVVGTAGHIDHGKSTLVRRLTGIDPDRLPEEKARGLTIDLGFANLALSDGSRLGIVDVPGHERFVHNMVAGATGIDRALLVVAADDGVMPQTVEHLEILELLGLRHGAIVLTKIDLVSPEMRALAADDVRAAVKGTFLESAPLFPVSSETGEGIDELRRGLESLARAAPPRRAGGLFRMPIQRVFAAKGFGCVVTGIPLGGSAVLGDRLEILPIRSTGTVRGLEAYHRTVERISAGHSSAVNLAGVDAVLCERGMTAATPGAFAPVTCVEARLRHLARRRRPLRDRDAIRLHCGTGEVGARLRLLDRSELAPGDDALVQFQLDEPIVAAAGDRYLIRTPSPAATVGGGTLVGVSDRPRKRRRAEDLEDLAAGERAIGDARATLLLALRRFGLHPAKPATLAVAAASTDEECAPILESLAGERLAVRLKSGSLLHRDAFDEARRKTEETLASYFRAHAERLVCDRLALREGTGLDGALLEEVLGDLAKSGAVVLDPGGGVRAKSKEEGLSPELAKLREAAAARLAAARFRPPTVAELTAELGAPRAQIDAVLKRLVDERRAWRISPEFHFSAEAIEEARRMIASRFSAAQAEVDLPSLRDALDTTRRWLIPLMEWFDATGFTTRLGARRILKRREREN